MYFFILSQSSWILLQWVSIPKSRHINFGHHIEYFNFFSSSSSLADLHILPLSFRQPMHSALKLEKSAISKVQKHIFCNFKKGKKSIFAHGKSLKLPKMQFSEFFLVQKLIFLPFLKMQIMCFCTIEIALFSNFRALCNTRSGTTMYDFRNSTDTLWNS